jgi:hypothetical protein
MSKAILRKALPAALLATTMALGGCYYPYGTYGYGYPGYYAAYGYPAYVGTGIAIGGWGWGCCGYGWRGGWGWGGGWHGGWGGWHGGGWGGWHGGGVAHGGWGGFGHR